jgi:nitroreductase
MNTLTKLALGMIGSVKAAPPKGEVLSNIVLPPPQHSGCLGVMDALRCRQSQRDFIPEALSLQTISNVVWAACGVNRPDLGGRTAPSAMNAQEMDLYLAMPQGLYLYEQRQHYLQMVVAQDVRRVTGYQDFVDNAPLDLVFVADHSRMRLVPASKRTLYSAICGGAMAQNIALYCAATGLACVVRAWFDHHALFQAMRLGPDQHILLAQTIGKPKLTSA